MDPIVIVPWYEPVRLRPAMYVGWTDDRGLFTMFREAFGFSSQDFRCGHVTRIMVTLHADQSISIEDDGIGPALSPLPAPESGTAFEQLMTKYSGVRGRSGQYEGAIPLTPAVINALSTSMEVESRVSGRCGTIRYQGGQCVVPLNLKDTVQDDGFRMRFRYDDRIFAASRLESTQLRQWLWEQSALHPGLLVLYSDESKGTTERFRSPEGVMALLTAECREMTAIWPDPLRLEMRQGPFRYDLALHCLRREEFTICSFANGSPTPEGGAYVLATYEALNIAFRRFLEGTPEAKSGVPKASLLRGLVAAIAVDLPHAEYVGPTREKLANHEVEETVHQFVREGLTTLLKRKPDHVKSWRHWIALPTK